MPKNEEKKRIEAYVLRKARDMGVPIPIGEIPGEEPDFRIETATGSLGIEVTELLRPASSNSGIIPVEEEAFHREVIQLSQRKYYSAVDAKPARAMVIFAKANGNMRNKRQMALSLAECVKKSLHLATPFTALSGVQLPEGFESVGITTESIDWSSSEGGTVTLSEIPVELAARIKAKNERLPAYCANLPSGAHVWLLIYTGVAVSRSMPIPHGIEEWKFPFDFERVFWFALLEGQMVEIQRAPKAREGIVL